MARDCVARCRGNLMALLTIRPRKQLVISRSQRKAQGFWRLDARKVSNTVVFVCVCVGQPMIMVCCSLRDCTHRSDRPVKLRAGPDPVGWTWDSSDPFILPPMPQCPSAPSRIT